MDQGEDRKRVIEAALLLPDRYVDARTKVVLRRLSDGVSLAQIERELHLPRGRAAQIRDRAFIRLDLWRTFHRGEWTKEPPTEPGFYWVREHDSDVLQKPAVAKLEEDQWWLTGWPMSFCGPHETAGWLFWRERLEPPGV